MGRHSKPDLPENRRSDGLTSTGYHRAVGKEATRRGIAKWPIAIVVVLAVIGAGAMAMVWGNNALNNRADAEAQGCPEGRRTLRIAVAPKLEEPISAIADKWNAADRVVHSHCITVEIGVAGWRDALDAIRQTDAVRAVPAAWIAESAEASDQLEKSSPGRVATVAKPLSSRTGYIHPYIVIGGDGVDDVQQRAAQSFRNYLSEAEPKAVLGKAGYAG